MAEIPNFERAVIAPEKLSGYLLDPNHAEGGAKARFFLGFGFSAQRPEALATALLAHAKGLEATVSPRHDRIN